MCLPINYRVLGQWHTSVLQDVEIWNMLYHSVQHFPHRMETHMIAHSAGGAVHCHSQSSEQQVSQSQWLLPSCFTICAHTHTLARTRTHTHLSIPHKCTLHLPQAILYLFTTQSHNTSTPRPYTHPYTYMHLAVSLVTPCWAPVGQGHELGTKNPLKQFIL